MEEVRLKRCSDCKIEKGFEQFSKNKSTKDGYQKQCKSCTKEYQQKNKEKLSEYNKEYREQNKDKILEQSKEYYELNRKEILEQRKKYRQQNKDKISEYKKEYREQNKEKISEYQKEYQKEYYQQNKDKISEYKKEYQKEYYEQNKEKLSQQKKEYYEQNRDKCNALTAKRRAKKLQATPPWLTPEHFEEIAEFYTTCKLFQMYTGLTYHVDHIVPLQGKTVCGLHVPWNLQILEASENLSKHNRLLEEF